MRKPKIVESSVVALLREYGITPKKQRSQNFLIDDDVYDSILAAAALTRSDTVLEVGPGVGSLTERLVAVAGKVVAIEIDRALVNVLHTRFSTISSLVIHEGDALSKPVSGFGIESPYRVVANIPYNITAKLIRKFLTDDTQPLSMTLLVQREVAARLAAPPGRGSLLSLCAQLYATVRIIRNVPAVSFYPVPDVESALVQFDDIHPYPFAIPEKFFWRVARIGFAGRRKQLRTNLRAGFQLTADVSAEVLAVSGIPPLARAQELSIEQWHALARVLNSHLSLLEA